ncbi:MAG: hypothetical protein JNM80_15105 [Phycisphaerae bacterium]|nr:hypothetical protein [Phycisphaerae bacterium]
MPLLADSAAVLPATIVLGIVAAYALTGAAFCAAFLARGLARLDHASHGAHPLFRVFIVPGVIALWPLVLRLWLRAGKP